MRPASRLSHEKRLASRRYFLGQTMTSEEAIGTKDRGRGCPLRVRPSIPPFPFPLTH